MNLGFIEYIIMLLAIGVFVYYPIKLIKAIIDYLNRH